MTESINYISKVEIYNLWQKFDIEWNLNPDVNVLAGINGSGKTTILDLICGVLTKGIAVIYQKNYDQIVITFDNGKRFVLDNTTSNTEELYKIIKIDVISTFDNIFKTTEIIRELSDNRVKTDLDFEISGLQKRYLDYQLNISKRKDKFLEEGIPREVILKLKQPQNHFFEIIDSLFKDTKKRINRDINEVSFITYDNVEISPYRLSAGEKQLLVILLTVLVRDNKQTILFMDEPEISLHIDWQKKLIQYIRELNPNVQIILATHSPAIIMEGWLDKVTEVRDIIVKDRTQKVENDNTQR